MGTASAAQTTVTTATYGENLFDYSNGVLTNHDGVTYERSVDGVIVINDERFLAFAIRGDRGSGTETVTSMDFSWDWTVEQVGQDYIFHATNNNDNFLWEQTWYFYHDQGTPMKIEHYLENKLGVAINDATMFYIITVNENDTLEYNRIIYPVSDYTAEPLHKEGNFNDMLASVDFNDIFGFNFGDLINTGFNITEIYIGNFDFSGYPNQNILAVGFTKGDGVFPSGYSVSIDPQIVAEPDTYAVYGLYDSDFLDNQLYAAGWDGNDIDTGITTEMTSTQYAALSTDDTTYAVTGSDAQDDGFLYVNFSVPYVDSINWFNIEVIAIGDGTDGWFMGAYDDVADGWVTMNSTVATGDVSLTYNVTGAEVATYSDITGTDATFSVAIWSSVKGASIVDGDLISVTLNYEYDDTTKPTYSGASVNASGNGKPCEFSITYNDNFALENDGQYIFATNNTGVWINESAVNFTSTPETIQTVKTLNSTIGVTIGYRWYADDNNGNINNTPIYTKTTVDDFWDVNYTIVNGLGDYGQNSKPTVFYNLFGDNKWHIIIGYYEGGFSGYQWNGTGWEGNATIINGLPDIGNGAAPKVFYNLFDDDMWHMIAGEYYGGWHGYRWNGTGWDGNGTVRSGLVDEGNRPTFTIFQDLFGDDKWHIVSGVTEGTFFGYHWNDTGTTWEGNTTVASGLGDIGLRSSPFVIQDLFGNNEWHLISGNADGTYTGFEWNGSGWDSNDTVASGLTVHTNSIVCAFQNFFGDGERFAIAGELDGTLRGYRSYFERPPETNVPTYSNAAHNTSFTGESCLFSIEYNDDTVLHPTGQYIFATNNTGVWVNESAVNFTSTPESISTIKTLNSTGNIPIGYRWYADDNDGNINNTPIYTLTTAKLPGIKISGIDSTPIAATSYSTSRKIVRTSDGTLWAIYVGIGDDIFAVNSTDNGSTWNTPEMVSDTSSYGQDFPTAAVDSNNVLHVMWYGPGWGSNSSDYDIQYKNRTASGWGVQENVTDVTATQFGPSVAVDSNDVVHLMWYGLGWGSNSSDYDIQYKNRTASGWGTHEQVTDVVERQRFPNIAIDSNDNFHVVWYGHGWGNNPDKRNAVYRNRTAGVWGNYQLLSDNGKENYFPVITIDNDDDIHVAWRVLEGSNTSIYYRNKTSSWGVSEEIRTSTNDEQYPAISADNSNNIHIIWDRNSDGTLWYVNKTDGWDGIEYLGHAGSGNTSYPGLAWSMWPLIDGVRPGVPETGVAYVHTNSYADIHVRYDSRYLTWQTAAAYNISYANVSETVTITDTITLTKTSAPLEIDVSDDITITDAITIIKTVASVLYNAYVEETVTITDSVSITKIVAPIIYEVYEDEIITITDSIDVNKILASVMYYANVSDTVTFTDGLVVIKTVASVLYTTKIDDTITVTDSVGITKTSAPILNKINISDTVGIADSVSIEKTTASIFYTSNVSDTITVTDGVALTKTLAAINYTSNVSDIITITDGVTLSKTTAGINYTTNVSDTITIADGVVITKTLASVNYSINVSETIAFTDSVTLTKTTASVNYTSNVSETITFADGVALTKTTAGINYAVNISDTIAIVDSVSLTKTLAAINYTSNVSDTITFADSASLIKTTAVINYTRNVSDTISITDSVALIKTLAAINYTSNVSEIITVTDSVVINKTVAGINYSIDEPETITYTDTVSVIKTLAAINYTTNVSDTITFVDGVSLEKTTAAINYSINISDSITLADSVVMNKTLATVSYNISTPDTISVTDDVEITKTTAGINYSINISDTVTLSDTVSITKTLAAINYTSNVSDTIAYTDSVALTKSTAGVNYTTNVSDTITYSDDITITKTLAAINYSTNISDIITITDSVAMDKTTAFINYTVNMSDTITLTDSVSIEKTLASINYSVNTSDTIAFIDSVSLSKTTAGAINYTVNISDTITINDSVSLTKTSAANNEVFSFTNATIVPSTLTRDEPFIVLVDINDTDGTIVEAVVKISSINYTMSNVGGDTWSYIFAEPNFARRYYVTDFYAKDDFGAWNGTTSTLSISATPVRRGGRGITTPTPTPVPTPEIIPTVYPEKPMEFIEVTDRLLNFLGDFIFAEDVFIFKIIFDPNERIITKTFYRDDTFSCIHSPSVTHGCIMDNSNIAVSVDVDVDKSFIHDEVLNDIVYDENSELYVDVKVFIINLMVGLHLMDTDINNPSLYFFTDNTEGKINGIRVLPMLLFATIGGLILYTGRNVRNIKMTDITYSYYYLDNYLTTKAKTIKNKDTWRTWYNTWHDDLVTKAKETRKTLKFKYNYYRRYVRNYIWAFRIRKGL